MLDTPLQSDHKADREALARLIATGIFARSPNLEKILVYLCNNYFEGRGGFKEYHVATEALGRPENFDPKKDSIVRVEMHRLRKRLREYYASADPQIEPIRILIPEKSYVPEFQANRKTESLSGEEETASLDAGASDPVGTAPPLAAGWWSTRRSAATLGVLVAAAAATVAGSYFWLLPGDVPIGGAEAPAASSTRDREGVAGNRGPTEEPAASGSPLNQADVIRVMAGRPPGRYTDRFGQVWEGDRFFSGGAAVAVNQEVASRGFDPNLFANMREGDFTYDIPLQPGVYELLLLFAETQYGERNPLGGGETSRLFAVSANGKPLLTEFDATADAADANTASARRFRDLSPGSDGKLHLRFGPASVGKAFVNGLVISPGLPGRMRPIRIVCRPESYRDTKGNIWEADKFFRSGKQITRPQGAPAPESEVFRGERYGNFSYVIPVPQGTYGARLYFWEYWWGKNQPGRGGPGSRVFDVFCNHKPLLLDFDIIRQNPREQVVVQTFHSLTPNAQGKLVFDFTPKANYGMVNAIEIFDDQSR